MRHKKNLWITCFLLALLLIFSPALVKADTHIIKNKHTDAVSFMGQTEPAKDETGGTWISKDKFREDNGEESSFIVRLDLKKIYFINHQEKTYAEMSFPVDLEKILAPEAIQRLQMMEITSKITPTSETRKIKNWNCKKYLIELGISMMGMTMPMTQEIWASKDLGIDLDLYKKFNKEVLAINPWTKGLADEIQKIEGYPVLSSFSMKMMGAEIKFQEEVVSVEKKDAPAGNYDIPEGYTKAAYNPFAQQR
ncbi:MAG: DUF4412 domain-containing protein [Candidatus Aminicenantaceae bacterium]